MLSSHLNTLVMKKSALLVCSLGIRVMSSSVCASVVSDASTPCSYIGGDVSSDSKADGNDGVIATLVAFNSEALVSLSPMDEAFKAKSRGLSRSGS